MLVYATLALKQRISPSKVDRNRDFLRLLNSQFSQAALFLKLFFPRIHGLSKPNADAS